MGTSTQQHSLDTWVTSTAPSYVFEKSTVLQVKSGERYAFVYFNRPFPLGATIISAQLTLRTYAIAGTGPRSLTVARTASRPTYAWMTWNNAPDVITGAGEARTVTKTGPLPGATEWVFDVAGHLQAVSDGAAWSGWRVETDAADVIKLYGVDGNRYVAELQVVWSDAPAPPSQLHPSVGQVVATPRPLLRWDYTDVAGDTEMKALQVQIHDSEDGHNSATGWSSPAWDSGIQLASLPQLDLAPTTFSGFTGSSSWWSVRVSDGADLWSPWSEPAEVRYVAKGAFGLISPTPDGTVGSPASLDDATPVVSWSFPDQTAYRVRVWLNTRPKTPLWDTGRRTSTDTSVTVPSGELRWDDRLYRFQVDAWDDLDRASTPGSPAAYTATSIALLDWDQTLEGTAWVSARALDPYPFVELEWNRDIAPDGWTITRNTEVIATLEYADTLQEDGTHRWVDRYVPARTEHRYVVRPRVNKKTAWGNPTAVVVSRPGGVWLVNDVDEVCLHNASIDSLSMGEVSTVHEPITGDRVVQVRAGLRGYEGSVTGLLVGGDAGWLPGTTARQWHAALLRIKRDGGAYLTADTLSIPVLTANVVAAPVGETDEQYNASFSFWQRGFFDWDALGEGPA